ncbi:hypothetical protein ACAF76_006725 [Brevibacillus sp. TJ4]|uniref:hypothetical protein n=1 Tax=Brevibacillus sp. TJ4 TaxID=3234853 RepID=UPI0037D33842
MKNGTGEIGSEVLAPFLVSLQNQHLPETPVKGESTYSKANICLHGVDHHGMFRTEQEV